jgi:hypothetical protein
MARDARSMTGVSKRRCGFGAEGKAGPIGAEAGPRGPGLGNSVSWAGESSDSGTLHSTWVK